jgi:hypothetical protein
MEGVCYKLVTRFYPDSNELDRKILTDMGILGETEQGKALITICDEQPFVKSPPFGDGRGTKERLINDCCQKSEVGIETRETIPDLMKSYLGAVQAMKSEKYKGQQEESSMQGMPENVLNSGQQTKMKGQVEMCEMKLLKAMLEEAEERNRELKEVNEKMTQVNEWMEQQRKLGERIKDMEKQMRNL